SLSYWIRVSGLLPSALPPSSVLCGHSMGLLRRISGLVLRRLRVFTGYVFIFINGILGVFSPLPAEPGTRARARPLERESRASERRSAVPLCASRSQAAGAVQARAA